MSAICQTISLAETRQIVLRAQGLADNAAPFGSGKQAVLNAIEHLGYVQIDTISVVQRAHHHVIWSRVPDYQPTTLHELHEADRAVFEYWNHAASYLPMRDFRFSLPAMRAYQRSEKYDDNSPEMAKAMRRLRQRIRKAGPLLLRDVKSNQLIESWWNAPPSKIEKRALHKLWMGGQIMVSRREGFQKVFDLPERVLPSSVDQKMPTMRETAEFHVRRSLRALGVARVPELHYLHESESATAVKAAIRKLLRDGEIIELRVAEFPDIPCYAMADALSLASAFRERRLRFLSPFDNLVIQRKRTSWLFNFDFIIECYVPAPKRQFGYFVLPILWGDELIARMDAKADRASGTLLIHKLIFEPTFNRFSELQPEWHRALQEFMSFQGCKRLKIGTIKPNRTSFRHID